MMEQDLVNLWSILENNITNEIAAYECSNYFLGRSYQLLPEPELPKATLLETLMYLAYTNEFTTTFTGFDCMTFVETVLALVLSRNCYSFEGFLPTFLNKLLLIRYKQGLPYFLQRNYFFPCVDWLINNKWLVKDLTEEIGNNILYAKTMIDKPSWLYNSKLLEPYREDITLMDLLTELQAINYELSVVPSVIPYISIIDFLKDPLGYIDRFPDLSIIWIVRPNWDVKEKFLNYGTHLNISHIGFCFKKYDNLFFCHASSTGEKKVELVKFTDYLDKFLDSETIKGFNISMVKF